MDIDEISRVLARENSQSLNSIPADFFQEAAKYVRKLEAEIREIDNRRSPESKLLEDEAERAVSDLETIFMKRVKKIVTRAKNQAQARSDRPIAKDLEKMLPSEKRLYELVLAGIEASKSELLGPILNPESAGQPVSWPQLSGASSAEENGQGRGRTQKGRGVSLPPSRNPELFQENSSQNMKLFRDQDQAQSRKQGPGSQSSGPGAGGSGEAGEAGEPERAVEAAGSGDANPGRPGEKAGAVSGKNDINKDFVLVRILKDLPTFTGADGRNYTVKTEDLVVLPKMNATGLLKRKAAKLISVQGGPESQSEIQPQPGTRA